MSNTATAGSGLSSTTRTVAERGGQVAGSVLGGLMGAPFGPIGAWIGRAIGSRVGGMAAVAAAEAVASYMEDTSEDAEDQARDKDATIPCENCGKIDCFSPPEGADEKTKKEFRRHLAEQQDTINNMDAGDLVKNIDKYSKIKRPAGDAPALRTTREEYRLSRNQALERKYRKEGHNDFDVRANEEVDKEMAKLAATHTIDLVAGDDGSISGMGDRSINSSLGGQWKGRRSQQLRDHAEEAEKQGKKMNVTLEECPPVEPPKSLKSMLNGDKMHAGGSGPENSGIPIF